MLPVDIHAVIHPQKWLNAQLIVCMDTSHTPGTKEVNTQESTYCNCSNVYITNFMNCEIILFQGNLWESLSGPSVYGLCASMHKHLQLKQHSL